MRLVKAVDPQLWLARDGMPALLDALGGGADTVRPIGGAVRDALLGHEPKDLDLATAWPPEETARRAMAAGFRVVPTGLAHGTVTVLLGGGPVEVTTLRQDVATDGRHAEVAFTADWAADAGRRDFTMNALSADPRTGAVFDYFDGVADLEARRVRFIGEPLRRIAEDHLRILRFFRFTARFGGVPDAAALAACTGRANDLLALSRERIASELLQLLALPDPAPTVRLMLEAGVLPAILPECGAPEIARLASLVAREQRLRVAPDPIRRFAALLPADTVVADSVGARLRLSNVQRARLARLAAPIPPEARARALRDRWSEEDVVAALLLGPADDGRVAAELGSLSGWVPPAFPVKGGDLIARGLPVGPIVARTLAAVRDQWVAADFPAGGDLDRLVADAVAQALRERA